MRSITNTDGASQSLDIRVDTLSDDNRNTARGILRRAKLSALSDKAVIWDIPGSSKKLGYSTHNLYRFFGKFPPPIATYLIERYCGTDQLCVDTMVGSGTTLLEAASLGRQSIGIDSNPLCCLISQAKTTNIPPEILTNELNRIEPELRRSGSNDELVRDSIPEFRNIDHWFFPEDQVQLAKIKMAIEAIKPKEIRDFFLVVFASTIRKISRAGDATGRQFLDRNKQPTGAIRRFISKAKQSIESMNSLSIEGFADPEIVCADARKTPVRGRIADLVICHPPYFNLYNFSSINRFEMYWLGMDYRKSRRTDICEGFKQGKASLLPRYIRDMKEIMAENFRIMKNDGHCALMIGDTIIKGKYVPTTSNLLDELDSDFLVRQIAVRRPRFTESSWATSQRRTKKDLGPIMSDFVLLLEKS